MWFNYVAHKPPQWKIFHKSIEIIMSYIYLLIKPLGDEYFTKLHKLSHRSNTRLIKFVKENSTKLCKIMMWFKYQIKIKFASKEFSTRICLKNSRLTGTERCGEFASLTVCYRSTLQHGVQTVHLPYPAWEAVVWSHRNITQKCCHHILVGTSWGEYLKLINFWESPNWNRVGGRSTSECSADWGSS